MLDTTRDVIAELLERRAIAAIFRSTPITLSIGLMLSLASCGDEDGCDIDYYGDCVSGITASELSLGLVAGDFNGRGLTSIIQTSSGTFLAVWDLP
jgi:hypothetical protein